MTEEYYQSLQAEFKDFVDTCCESYPIFRKWSSFMTWADGIEQKIAQLTAERDELKLAVAQTKLDISAWKNICTEWYKDAERLAKYFIWEDGEYGIYTCIHCDTEGKYTGGLYKDILEEQVVITHSETCPITLHRQLVKKYEVTK